MFVILSLVRDERDSKKVIKNLYFDKKKKSIPAVPLNMFIYWLAHKSTPNVESPHTKI